MLLFPAAELYKPIKTDETENHTDRIMENSNSGNLKATNSRVVIAVNPNAGASETAVEANKLADELRSRGFSVQIESDLDQLIQLASDPTDLHCIVAAGGDGTIGLLVNRLPANTPFALLPQGTENLLAKHLEVPFAAAQVAKMIDESVFANLDVGKANDQLFLVMASCGFDAEVVHRVHKARKGHIRHWSYAKPILNSIRKYKYPTLSIFCGDDKKAKPIKAKWAFVFNAPRYAMGLPIADQADAMDGVLDLCAFRGGNLLNGLMYLTGVVFRQHRRWKDTNIATATVFRIESEDEVPYQIDGDPGGYLPLDLRVVPKYLKIIVPKAWAEKHGLPTPTAPNVQTNPSA